MKKRFFAVCIALLLSMSCLFVACDGELIQSFDKNKTQVYVSVFDGGYGHAWLDSAAADFNKLEEFQKYEIIISPSKTEEGYIYESFQSGTPAADVFFTSNLYNIKEMIANDYVLDLSDIYKRDVDGNGTTIEGKMKNPELYKKAFSDTLSNKEGIYMIPNGDSFIHFIYDHQHFVDNGWLFTASTEDESALTEQGFTFTKNNGAYYFSGCDHETNYKEGDRILAAGKDEKFGTYDDGQPINLEQWETMLNKIKGNGNKAFLWSSRFSDCTMPVSISLLAQYEGVDNFNLLYSYNGTYNNPAASNNEKLLNGQKITEDNAYLLWNMEGFYQSFDFMKKYMCGTGYYHGSCIGVSGSQTDAQNEFLMSYDIKEEERKAAMLVDGIWWENEARPTFLAIGATSPSRGYGKRDYRVMLTPDLPGQIGVRDDNGGSVLCMSDTGAVFAYKSKDEEKNKVAKEFIAFSCKDEYLRQFVVNVGASRPFKVTLTEEDYAAMTPFAKNVWAIINDTENIDFVRPNVSALLNNINSVSDKRGNLFNAIIPEKTGNRTYSMPLSGLFRTDNTASDYAKYCAEYYENRWSGYLEDIREWK